MSFMQVLMRFMSALMGYRMLTWVPSIGGDGGIDPCRGEGCFSELDMMEQ
jgi:hypothetical protein